MKKAKQRKPTLFAEVTSIVPFPKGGFYRKLNENQDVKNGQIQILDKNLKKFS